MSALPATRRNSTRVLAGSGRIAADVVTGGERGRRTTGERDAERCKDRAQKKSPTANHGCLSFPACPKLPRNAMRFLSWLAVDADAHDPWALGRRQGMGRGSVTGDYISRKGSSAAWLAICGRKLESATPTSRTPFGGGNTDRIRSRATRCSSSLVWIVIFTDRLRVDI
jgi:hypothetical protein